MSKRAARRRTAQCRAKASRGDPRNPPEGGMSIAGATALDAIRVNGRETFFAKTFALMESNDPRERAVAEFMLRGGWKATAPQLISKG